MADADADTRPNVLLVLTDQERYDAAHPRVPDRNAGDRSALERGRPLRAGGHTDQYLLERSRVVTDRPVPHGHGMLNNCHEPDAIRANLPADLSTFSEELVAAGYDLTYTGKWHAGRDQTPPISGSRISGAATNTTTTSTRRSASTARSEASRLARPTSRRRSTPARSRATAARGRSSPQNVRRCRGYASLLSRRTDDRRDRIARGRRPRRSVLPPDGLLRAPPPLRRPGTLRLNVRSRRDRAPESYAETYDGKPQVHENYLAYRGVTGFDWDLWAEALAKYWGSSR